MTSRTERFRKATLATLRTLSGDATLTPPAGLTFDNEADMDEAQRLKTRGLTDAYALKTRYHDPDLPVPVMSPEARHIFDTLEQARCEIYGSRHLDGVRANLHHRLVERGKILKAPEMTTRKDMPSSLALELLARESMLGYEFGPELGETALQQWRKSLSPQAKLALRHLAETQSDQKKFMQAGQELLASLGLVKKAAHEAGTDNPLQQTQDETGESQSQEGSDDTASEESGQQAVATEQEDDANTESASPGSDEMEALLTEGEQGNEEAAGPSHEKEENCALDSAIFPDGYKIYTREFDEIIPADELCDAEELHFLREQLDRQLEQTKEFVSRLAHRLQRRLLAQQQRHWSFDEEEGILDAARLPRIVSNPSLPLSYKLESNIDFKETIVTLLIDNSGSMRGTPITTAALCSDILARTLERCGVKVELLGFTTRAWKGGQSRYKWTENGKPPKPGRLNDLRHIIYKSADIPWRRARLNLGLMLRDGLLKENIDGEALLWASRRLRSRPEHRRILMVISDGAPVDDSTSSANTPDYLDDHLHKVIARLEADLGLELLAIGIGHDVTRYYANSVTISSAADLGDTMVSQLSALFTPSTKRRRTVMN
ncbi:cobaltochelatase subunit CobT [Acetobacteraceae bacterium ESL0709]|nr:cobaltochelatase subunit CobT [Acetobacteraceae bacterium ESL0697]MDF7678300.1 cobaltochelatase subunit CobT [Acetobacteraceae bacterium ESL0709]